MLYYAYINQKGAIYLRKEVEGIFLSNKQKDPAEGKIVGLFKASNDEEAMELAKKFSSMKVFDASCGLDEIEI